MYSYRNDPLYPAAELTPEIIEAAMINGRRMRAQAMITAGSAVFGALVRLGSLLRASWTTQAKRPAGAEG